MMKLSDRLQFIADEINKGETMADIGTDHGFLPLYLWEAGICPKVIMTDISSGSLNKAMENCRSLYPLQKFDFRRGDGIDVLANGEADVVVMAGMGGLLMIDILEWDIEKSHSMKKYILQPRNHVGRLRHWLYCNGFEIIKEGLVREGRYICEILTVRNSGNKNETAQYSAVFDFPDSLLTFCSPLTEQYLRQRLDIEEKINQNIRKNSKNSEVDAKVSAERMVRIKHLLREMEENDERE